jgi:DNA-binding FadR family transcriptional regulator
MAPRAPGKNVQRVYSRGTPLRIHGTIAQDLGRRIVSGECPPGFVLGNEIVASGQLSVSRTAYREAVRILSAKGLVQSRPKIGTRVSPPKDWHLLDPDVLSWIFQNEPDRQLLASLYELWRIIGPEAAALAAKRRTADHLRAMDTALNLMAEHTLEVEEGRAARRAFHSSLLDASGNAFLGSLSRGVEAAVSWMTELRQRNASLIRDPILDHRKVLDAIASGDPAAAYNAMAELGNSAFTDATVLMGIETAQELS